MRDLASDDRPREKLLRHGAERLSESELVAIILGSGVRGRNVVEVARELLKRHQGLMGLMKADPAALKQTPGLGPARAAQLSAAFELARRVRETDGASRPQLTTPDKVFAYLGSSALGKTNEQLCIIALDTRGRLLGESEVVVAHGGANSVRVRAADVFREPLLLRAASVVLVHNHPSGDPRPSPQDIAITADLAAAGELLEMPVQDHIILGQNTYFSMKKEGYDLSAGKRRPR